MSDLPPAAPAAGLPALPYSPGDRPQFLSAMLAELVRTDTADGQPFGLTTRGLDDPTVDASPTRVSWARRHSRARCSPLPS
jgi:hypothetical protein